MAEGAQEIPSATRNRPSIQDDDPVAQLLLEIEHFCKSTNTAESTFGRQCVNDGKLCSRLRSGKNVTVKTAQKIRSYISSNSSTSLDHAAVVQGSTQPQPRLPDAPRLAAYPGSLQKRHFRFYDNRQKYLAFINTCNDTLSSFPNSLNS